MHYALVAELAGCELYAVGGGTRRGAETRVSEETSPAAAEILGWRRERLAAVAERARAFGGALTHAGTQPPSAADPVELWPSLDVFGLDAFATFGSAERPDDPREAVARRVASVASGAGSSGLPLLLTGVGFPASERAWRDPSAPSGRPDPALQAELLEGLADGLERARSRGVAPLGFFLVGWGAGGARGRGFGVAHEASRAAVERLLSPP